MDVGEQQIFNSLVEFFEEDDWDFQWIENMPVLSLGFAGNNGKWTCYAQAREAEQQFVFYSVLPINVPEEHRPAIAEFITRANYGMILGNFEMDFSDGEVRYKTSIDVEGASLVPPLIRQIVYANVVITDRYLPGLMRVIYGGLSPLEAIKSVEDWKLSASSRDAHDGDEVREIDLDDHDNLEDINGLEDLDNLYGYEYYDDDDDFDDHDDGLSDDEYVDDADDSDGQFGLN